MKVEGMESRYRMTNDTANELINQSYLTIIMMDSDSNSRAATRPSLIQPQAAPAPTLAWMVVANQARTGTETNP